MSRWGNDVILDACRDDTQLNREARFVIVGAGPAGMTLARRLAHCGPVLLLESGGFDVEAPTQALYAGESVGLPYSLLDSRARRFGGTSSLWGGWCTPFDAEDFRVREWVPDSGWPLSVDDLQPYYAQAAALLHLGESRFDTRAFLGSHNVPLPFDPAVVCASIWHFGQPTVAFGAHWRNAFRAEPGITTLLHANVTDISLDARHRHVERLCVRTLNGRVGWIQAQVVILACGGIETPRLLLNANRQIPNGIGNEQDLLGRYFMEHPHLPIASMADRSDNWYVVSRERALTPSGHGYMLGLGLTPTLQRELKVLNARMHVYRQPSMGNASPRLGLFAEQAPNRESRVTLDESTDALGLRKVRLTWQLNALDLHSFQQSSEVLIEEISRICVGTAKPLRLRGTYPGGLGYTNHHIGTTRMAHNQHTGVVDADCKVFGIDNLYVAGSSVFPTASWANPTFTILALALRLADQLLEKDNPGSGSGQSLAALTQ